MKSEYEERVSIAYANALWVNLWQTKNQPEPLEKILGRKPEPKQMEAEDILSQVKAINAALGGEVV